MQSFYYLAMLIGIGWLAIWCILPKPYSGKGWWPFAWSPFDMIEDVEDKVDAVAPGDTAGRRRALVKQSPRSDASAVPAWRTRALQTTPGGKQRHEGR